MNTPALAAAATEAPRAGQGAAGAPTPAELSAAEGSASASPRRVVGRERVFARRDAIAFAALTVLNFAAVGSLAGMAVRARVWQVEPAAFAVLGLLACALIASNQVRWFLLPLMHRPRPVESRRPWRVGVATTFVPGAEPLAMLEKSVQALVALDAPHETWVLDEGDDDEVRAICRKHGARHFSRRHHAAYQAADGVFKSGSKHGNYNAWLAETGYASYDIVAAFDPDHVPQADYLAHVLGYFESPQVGYVQVAQAYGNQAESWIARGAAEETYDYFSTLQMASDRLGYPVIVGGHNVHRVDALRAIDGFAAHDADDLLATLHYRAAGWQGVYVPQILARGLSPADWTSYLAQQRRWARSVLDVKFRASPRMSGSTPLATRIMSMLHGLNYLAKGLVPVAFLCVLGLLCLRRGAAHQLVGAVAPGLAAVIGAFALGEAFRQRFYLDPRRERGIPWRAAVLRWAKWPQMALALADVALDRRPAYSITGKGPAAARSASWLAPHLAAAAALIACWAVGYRMEPTTSPWVDGAVACVVAATAALGATCFRAPRTATPTAAADRLP